MPGIVVSTADYATVGIRGCSLVLLCFLPSLLHVSQVYPNCIMF